MRLVSVVMRTRWSLSTRRRISFMRSSICPSVGRTSTSGSMRPVGRMICSAMLTLFSSSNWPGVALTKMSCGTFSRNSSKRSGRLSRALGRRKP